MGEQSTRAAWSRGPRIEWDEDPETGCWNWQGPINGGGYATCSLHGKTRKVHRLIYEWERAPIPDGLTLDHLCRNRACVNPDHMEPVTNRVNILRGESFSATLARQTHCKHGHPFSGDNLEIDRDGFRRCITCRRQRQKKRWRRLYGKGTWK